MELNKVMKRGLVSFPLFLFAVNVGALEGKIVDSNNKAVANASIQVIGTSDRYQTASDGTFNIPHDNVDEIHIEAEGFSHKVLHLHGDKQFLSIELSRSVIEVLDVVGIPIHASKIESAQPISVIGGEALRKKQASTLGETLKNEVGVQSSYYAGVASSPIIRGLDGPRVLITQNSLDVSDASRVGPDHVVATEASTAKQIEILRGPSTLFYGSGAIGGLVNIVDDRVPSDSEQAIAVATEYNTVNDETLISGAYTGGTDQFAFHVDAFDRDGDDYDIPGIAILETEEEHEEEGHEEHEEGTLENSASESRGFNIGSSFLFDNGHVGISYGKLERVNGIPGHGHGGHEEHEEEEAGGEEEHEDEHAEENVSSELDQDRWQLHSSLTLDNTFLSGLNVRIGYTDYEHDEVHEEAHEEHEEEEGEEGHEEHEGHEEGTVFKNETLQARVDFLLKEFAGWKGAASVETRLSDFEAVGEEAFTPPSETEEFAIAVIQEKHAGNLLWQLGARIETVSLSAVDVEFHEEHEEEMGEPEGHEEHIEFDTFDFTPISLSAGFVWDFKPGYNFGVSLARAERAPNAAEIFSVGPHIATESYEAGALFEIHEEDGEFHLEYEGNAEKETSTNIDLTLRKFEGDFGFVLNVFYNDISDYFYQMNTGLTTEDLFHEEEEEEAGGEEEHHHAEELPVYLFVQEDATFYGLEMEVFWQLNDFVKLTAWGDSVSAELSNGDNLPRIPPMRLGSQLDVMFGNWDFDISASHYFDQDDVAVNETETDGYTLINAGISYSFPIFNGDGTVFLQGHNLADEEARVHTSFLKNQAPLPGRNFKIGFRANF